MKANLTDYHESGLHLISSYFLDCVEPMNEAERAHFVDLAKAYAAFSRLELVAWCVPTDHFHLLVRVPPGESAKTMDEEETLRRYAIIHGDEAAEKLRKTINLYDDPARRASFTDPIRARIGSLGSFIRHFKQRFAHQLNTRRNDDILIWNSTYRETLVEEERDAPTGLGWPAFVTAAYLAANPLRCGLAKDPKDYAWSSYGAAIAGDADALEAFALLGGGDPTETLAAMRELIYDDPAQHRVPTKDERATPFKQNADAALAAVGEDGTLPLGTLLRLRVRAMSYGMVLGRPAYVESIGKALGSWKKRGTAGFPLPMGDWRGLEALSRVRGEAVLPCRPSPPPGVIPNQLRAIE